MAGKEDLLKWARGAVGRYGSSEEFLAWAKKQAAKKGGASVISSADKLKSPYFLRNFATWKDVVDSAEALIKEEARIETEKAKPKATTTKEQKVASTMEQAQAEYQLTEAIRDSEYYQGIVENSKKSPAERDAARKEYDRLQAEIESLKGKTRETKVAASEVEKKATSESAVDKEKKLKKEYADLKAQYDALINPEDPQGKGPGIKKQIDALAKEYQQVYSDLVGTPVSYGVARSKLLGTELPTMGQTVAPEDLAAAKSTTTKTTTAKTTTSGSKTTPPVPNVPGKPRTPITPQAPASEFTPVDSTTPRPVLGPNVEQLPDGKKPVNNYEDAIAKAMELYSMPDIIFQNVDSLKLLLQKFVDKKLTLNQFAMEIQNDPWYRQNSKEIKARYIQKFNYEDLLKSKTGATGNTDYEQQIAKITRNIKSTAQAMGAAVDDTQAKLIAEDLYIHNMESDEAALKKRLGAFIRKQALGAVGGTGYSGEALQGLQTIQQIAKANGLNFKNIVPNRVGGQASEDAIVNDVLAGLQDGTIDINRLAQNARIIASQGQPQYVRDLLNQGYNLDAIYAPYRKLMADTLELNQDQVDLNDPTLRMAISDKGDMNTYDFQRALKKDNRWQYTQNAANEVSNKTLRVLQDFGFMG